MNRFVSLRLLLLLGALSLPLAGCIDSVFGDSDSEECTSLECYCEQNPDNCNAASHDAGTETG